MRAVVQRVTRAGRDAGRRDRAGPLHPARRRRRRRAPTRAPGSPARSPACGSSPTARAGSTARWSTPAAPRSSSASSRCSPTRRRETARASPQPRRRQTPNRSTAFLRRTGGARRPGRDGRVRRQDGGRARERRPGDDHHRRLTRPLFVRGWHKLAGSGARAGSATVLAPFRAVFGWARCAHFLSEGMVSRWRVSSTRGRGRSSARSRAWSRAHCPASTCSRSN